MHIHLFYASCNIFSTIVKSNIVATYKSETTIISRSALFPFHRGRRVRANFLCDNRVAGVLKKRNIKAPMRSENISKPEMRTESVT